MKDSIIIQPSLRKHFHNAMQHGQVIVFHAPCGYGKTVAAKELLREKKVFHTSARENRLLLPEEQDDWDVLLVDDLQNLQDEALQTQLCEIIKCSAGQRFVLLTRGLVPNWLMDFRMAGLLFTVDKDMLNFSREDVVRYLSDSDLTLSNTEINTVLEKTLGYPAAVHFLKERLMRGSVLKQALFDAVREDLYHYLEGAVFLRLDKDIRALLLQLAPFKNFDIKAACAVNGSDGAQIVLRRLLRYSSMLEENEQGELRFHDIFYGFLQWEWPQYLSEQDYRVSCRKAGRYYEEKGQIIRALEAYSLSGDMERLAAILEDCADRCPELVGYGQLAPYYQRIPEEIVLRSPALMQGLSLMYGLFHCFEQSEHWYKTLQSDCEEESAEVKKEIRCRLLWLDTVLPQRDVSRLPEQLRQMYRLFQKNQLISYRYPVTGMLPSILNGGKDLSCLSRRDDEIYQDLKDVLPCVMGKDGLGLAECLYAESRFYKGDNVGRSILELVARLRKVQQYGTPAIEFAIVGLLVQNQLDMGNAENALRMAVNLRERFLQIGESGYLPNLDAMICRIYLYQDDINSADAWYREQAPLDCVSVDLQKRYQYLTQAMVEIAEGKYTAALITLASLELLLAEYGRVVDGMHLQFLKAIAFYRLDDGAWRECFESAFTTAQKLEYVRSVSMYGSAILPLLEKSGRDKALDQNFMKKVSLATRIQTAHYPFFLQIHASPSEELTAAEYNVLKLICAGKSNHDICMTLGIKLPTVKSHVSRILMKLGVRRRNEVKEAARRLYLIGD